MNPVRRTVLKLFVAGVIVTGWPLVAAAADAGDAEPSGEVVRVTLDVQGMH